MVVRKTTITAVAACKYFLLYKLGYLLTMGEGNFRLHLLPNVGRKLTNRSGCWQYGVIKTMKTRTHSCSLALLNELLSFSLFLCPSSFLHSPFLCVSFAGVSVSLSGSPFSVQLTLPTFLFLGSPCVHIITSTGRCVFPLPRLPVLELRGAWRAGVTR